MTTSWAWQSYADASADHRNPADADVAAASCCCRHDAELDRLSAEHRDLHDLWEPVR